MGKLYKLQLKNCTNKPVVYVSNVNQTLHTLIGKEGNITADNHSKRIGSSSKTVCYGISLESPRGGNYYEFPYHMFCGIYWGNQPCYFFNTIFCPKKKTRKGNPMYASEKFLKMKDEQKMHQLWQIITKCLFLFRFHFFLNE